MLIEAKQLTNEAKEKVILIKDILKKISFRSYLKVYETNGKYWFSIHFDNGETETPSGFSWDLTDEGVQLVKDLC